MCPINSVAPVISTWKWRCFDVFRVARVVLMNSRQGELTAHGRNCVTIIAVRASFCLIQMLLCKKEWRMGDEIGSRCTVCMTANIIHIWIQTRTTYTHNYIYNRHTYRLKSINIIFPSLWRVPCSTDILLKFAIRFLSPKIAQINHGSLPGEPRCPKKNVSSIRWGYFLPVKMPYGFGQ